MKSGHCRRYPVFCREVRKTRLKCLKPAWQKLVRFFLQTSQLCKSEMLVSEENVNLRSGKLESSEQVCTYRRLVVQRLNSACYAQIALYIMWKGWLFLVRWKCRSVMHRTNFSKTADRFRARIDTFAQSQWCFSLRQTGAVVPLQKITSETVWLDQSSLPVGSNQVSVAWRNSVGFLHSARLRSLDVVVTKQTCLLSAFCDFRSANRLQVRNPNARVCCRCGSALRPQMSYFCVLETKYAKCDQRIAMVWWGFAWRTIRW